MRYFTSKYLEMKKMDFSFPQQSSLEFRKIKSCSLRNIALSGMTPVSPQMTNAKKCKMAVFTEWL